jgi:Tfp pilus assembly protein PilO
MNEIYKKLSEVPPKKRPTYVFLVMLLAVLLFYFVQIIPLEDQITVIKVSHGSLTSKLAGKNQVLEKIRNGQADIETEKERITKLSSQLPNDVDTSTILRKIHNRKEEAKMKVERIEERNKIIKDLFVRIEIQMDISGSFSNILQFINELSDSKLLGRIVYIESLDLSKNPSATNTTGTELRGSFLLVTFMSKASLKDVKGPDGQPILAAPIKEEPLPQISLPERLKSPEWLNPKNWYSPEEIRTAYQYELQIQSPLRDPFTPNMPELNNADNKVNDPKSIENSLNIKINVPAQDLKLIMTITLAGSPEATFKDPAGLDYMVKVGDIIGRSPEYVKVFQILDDKVILEPFLGISQDDSNLKQKTIKELN